MGDIVMYEGYGGAGRRGHAKRAGRRTPTQRKFGKCAKRCSRSRSSMKVCMKKCMRPRRRH